MVGYFAEGEVLLKPLGQNISMSGVDRARAKLVLGRLFRGLGLAGRDGSSTSPSESHGFVGRAEALARYRALRDVMCRHFDAVDRYRSGQTVKDAAKRIGLVSGGRIVGENAGEMRLVDDLVLFGSYNGKSRAIDRYARAVSFAEGSDEAFVLAAMQGCSFHFLECKRRHRLAGIMAEDLLGKEELWVMDEALEASFAPGIGIAARLARHGAFHVALGVAVPMSKALFLEALLTLDWNFDQLPSQLDDSRLAATVYALAVRHGAMRALRVEPRTPPAAE